MAETATLAVHSTQTGQMARRLRSRDDRLSRRGFGGGCAVASTASTLVPNFGTTAQAAAAQAAAAVNYGNVGNGNVGLFNTGNYNVGIGLNGDHLTGIGPLHIGQ
ncbi:hypothetical protein [Mycobacterium angelicum]|uniref:hypothetical protein n=1 Tax=Mycobacterium angelicum TaxID=470074 RepID=UPI00111C06F8|nr:hypothetical protein [Mycobacterium angelicum]MCV7195938.1 hypothetical protein [Mycobacterium angelicum]